jgi:F-type H+-transporting ATPase subunit a
VTRTVVLSGVITLLLLGAAALLGQAVLRRPGSKVSAVARGAYRWIAALVADTAGKDIPRLTVFAGSLFAFITSCAVVGQLPGLRAPTASLATDAALAMLVFVAVPGSGIATRGLAGYLRDYVKPNPLFLPLHVISELSRTLALALRLFGNAGAGRAPARAPPAGSLLAALGGGAGADVGGRDGGRAGRVATRWAARGAGGAARPDSQRGA